MNTKNKYNNVNNLPLKGETFECPAKLNNFTPSPLERAGVRLSANQ
jgi:hypothetical protein